jgi:deoxyribodipyrimidine photolyase-related protein
MDSYEWVMYANIYGMIMYADGGFMMSRPYISSSTYIKKMSNYSKNKSVVKLKDGNEYGWDEIWDALYYNFINKHYAILKKIYATARNVYHWDNKSKEEQNRLLKLAKLYLDYL